MPYKNFKMSPPNLIKHGPKVDHYLIKCVDLHYLTFYLFIRVIKHRLIIISRAWHGPIFHRSNLLLLGTPLTLE